MPAGQPRKTGRPRRHKRSRSVLQPWRKRLQTVGRLVVYAFLLVFIVGLLAVVPLRWVNPPTTAFMLTDDKSRKMLTADWVSWADLGDSLPLAVVASEDQKFAVHSGFDLQSIQDSIAKRGAGVPLRGASTITQQVAKNLYLWRGRSFVRKGLEAYLSLVIEVALSKQRILEIYLNVAEFGPGIYGAGTAARIFFEKPPSVLTDREAALLAAVLPNPNRLHVNNPSEYVHRRQAWIFGQVQRLRREQWLYLIQEQ